MFLHRPKVILSLLFLSITVNVCFAFQSSADGVLVKGKVFDSENEAIQYASVALKRGNEYSSGVVTDDDGSFLIPKVQPGEYIVEVSFIGYETYCSKITIADKVLDLGSITLSRSTSFSIDEVTVTAEAPKETSSIEKTTIKTSRSMSAATGSILDVLSSSSSVSVDNSGTVSIRGNNKVLILINGIPTSIDALSSIPAASSKSVEIITSPDVSYDSEGTGGIINIITVADETSGFSGMAQANYGFNKHVNGYLSMSYVSKKMNLNFDYNGNYDDNLVNSSLDRFFHSSSSSIHQDILSHQKNGNNSIALNAMFNLSKKDKLSAGIRTIFPRNRNQQDLTVVSTENSIERNNIISFNRKVFEGNLGYTRVFMPEVNSLSITASFSQTFGSRPADYYQEGTHIQRSEGGGRPRIINMAADYKHNFSKKTVLTAGGKYTLRNNVFKYDSWINQNGEWIHSDFFSSDLSHRENIGAVYAMVASKLGKIPVKAGVRMEYSGTKMTTAKEASSEITSDKLFFSPYLYAALPLGKSNKFEFTFSRRITRPTYPQLNPFINMIDAVTYETGNKNLRPEVNTKIDLGYSLSISSFHLQSTLYYDYSKDYITQISSQYSTDALMITYQNGISSRAGLDLSARYSIIPQLAISAAANAFWGQSDCIQEDLNYFNQGWTLGGNAAIIAKPIKSMEIEMRYFFNTRQYFPQFTADRGSQILHPHIMRNQLHRQCDQKWQDNNII